MYAYALANDICDKDYSVFVSIDIEDDNEHRELFSDAELKILWDNKDDEIIEMLLFMCYSGFRIAAYLDMKTNLTVPGHLWGTLYLNKRPYSTAAAL